MRLSGWQYVFFLTIIFAFGYANAGAVVKRQSGSAISNLVTTIENALGSVPFVGSSLSGLIEWVVSIFNFIEEATNGGIARLLGGALPCTISLDEGTTCEGIKNNGGIGKLLMDVLDGIPSLLLPGFVKSVIKMAINGLINPTADVLFGGVSVKN